MSNLMLETRLRQIQCEAENLYRKMSGGSEISLKVIASPNTSVAGVNEKNHILVIHPDLLLDQEEAEKQFPKNRSQLCSSLRNNCAQFSRIRQAILAHEMAHIYLGHSKGNWHRHAATSLVISSGILLIPYFHIISFPCSLFTIWKLAIALLKPLRDINEQTHEYAADLKAVQTTNDPKALEQFLMQSAPYVKPSFTHPDPVDRIRYLRKHYAN